MFVLFIPTCNDILIVCYQTLYYPTNAHNVKNVELLKHTKIMKTAPTCFGLKGNHHQVAIAST
jgi:hypothetical protein